MRRVTMSMMVCAVGLLMFLYSGYAAFGADAAAYEETKLVLSDPTISAITVCGTTVARPADGSAIQADVSCLKPGRTEVQVTRDGVTGTQPYAIEVLSRRFHGGLAGVGVLLMILSVPVFAFRSSNVRRKDTDQPIEGWGYLLTEAQGLSLSRFQLFIWFVPGLIMFAILSWPVHQLPAVPDTLWELLGLGSATAALGIVATPKPDSAGATTQQGQVQPGAMPQTSGVDLAAAQKELGDLQQAVAAAAAALNNTPTASMPAEGTDPQALSAQITQFSAALSTAKQGVAAALDAVAARTVDLRATLTTKSDVVYAEPPLLRDLVEDFTGYGDVSRYQYLLLCVFTAGMLLLSFLQTWQIPALPNQLLALVATSQATYLAVKGIKTAQS